MVGLRRIMRERPRMDIDVPRVQNPVPRLAYGRVEAQGAFGTLLHSFMAARMVAFGGRKTVQKLRFAVKVKVFIERSHKIWWLRFFVVPLHRISKSPVHSALVTLGLALCTQSKALRSVWGTRSTNRGRCLLMSSIR
jgi:hypothetical protein